MQTFMLACLATQVVLLPGYLLYLWVVPLRAGVRFQWLLHRLLLGAVIVLPFLSLLPLPRLRLPAAAPVVIAAARAQMGTVAASRSHGPSTQNSVRPAFPLSPWAVPGLLSGMGLAAFAARVAAQKRREAAIARAGSIRSFGRLRIVVSPGAPFPFSGGLLKPAIYLPDEVAADPRERGMVLAHEAVHVRDRHYAWNLLEALLAAAFWFNPFMHLLRIGGRRIRELVCDQAVVRVFSATCYGALLARTAERALPGRGLALANGWLGRGMLLERVRFLLEGGPRKVRVDARLLAGIAGTATAVALFAALPFLTPAVAGGGRERAVETAEDKFPMESLFPVAGGLSGVTIEDGSRMLRDDPHNVISLDFRFPSGFGTAAVATTGGEVSAVTQETDLRYTALIRSEGGYQILYGNLAVVAVREGEKVAAGDEIGWVAPEPASASRKEPAATGATVEFAASYVDTSAPAQETTTLYGGVVIMGSGGEITAYIDVSAPPSARCMLHYEVDLHGTFLDSMTLRAPDAATVQLRWEGASR